MTHIFVVCVCERNEYLDVVCVSALCAAAPGLGLQSRVRFFAYLIVKLQTREEKKIRSSLQQNAAAPAEH